MYGNSHTRATQKQHRGLENHTPRPISELFATSSFVLGFSLESSTTFGPAEKLPGRVATGNPGVFCWRAAFVPDWSPVADWTSLLCHKAFFLGTRQDSNCAFRLRYAGGTSWSNANYGNCASQQEQKVRDLHRCEQRRDTSQSKHGKARE